MLGDDRMQKALSSSHVGQGITVKSFEADKVTEMGSLVGEGKLRIGQKNGGYRRGYWNVKRTYVWVVVFCRPSGKKVLMF